MRQAIRWSICTAVCLLIAGTTIADDSYAIFGRITADGKALAGVQVSASQWLGTQVTDADGKFRIEGALPDMTYEVTPTLTGHIFKPEKRTVLISSGDERANFVSRVADEGTVSAMSVTPAAAPPASKAGPDAYEADNRWERAKGIGRHETQTHNIHANWDVDWTTFTLPWRANLLAETAGVTGDTTLALYGPDDPTLHVRSDDDSGNGNFSMLRFRSHSVLQPGRYWLRVMEDGQNATIGRYTLALSATEAPAWRIIYPSAAGITWKIGSVQTIRWTGFDADTVWLHLLRHGEVHRLISRETPNDGSFVWQVPSDVSPGKGYRIGISTDLMYTQSAWSDKEFEIAHPTLVTYPSDRDIVWRRNRAYAITWSYFTGPTVCIELFRGTTLYRRLTAGTPNDGSFWWLAPADMPSGDDYKIRISDPSNASDSDMSDFPFTVALLPRVLYPSAAGIEIKRGASSEITWRGYSGTHVKITCYDGGVYADTIAASTPNDGSYTMYTPMDEEISDNYRIRITSLTLPSETDQSNNDFAVVTNARVKYPSAAGVVWDIGEVVTITWADFAREEVRIQLYKGATLNRIITRATPNDGRFVWRVPSDQDRGDDFRIRVVCGDDWDEFDFSNNYFTIASTPVVVSPNTQGITWRQGMVCTITWRDFPGDNVELALYSGTTRQETISASTPNDDAYVWRVPDTVPPGSNYRVEVRTTSAPHASDRSDYQFTIEEGPHVLAPNGGEVWRPGTMVPISWIRFPGENVRIRLYRGDTFERTITASTPNDGSFWWTPPDDLPSAGNYHIRVSAISEPGQWDASNSDFVITSNYPKVIYPSEMGLAWRHGEAVQITWSYFIGSHVAIELWRSGTFEHSISTRTDNDGSFWWQVPADVVGGTNYQVRVRSTSNSMEDISDNEFTIINVPTVLSPSVSGVTTRRTLDMPITWEGFAGSTVDIYLFKGTLYISTLEWHALNDGATTWSVPADLELGDDYWILIRSTTVTSESDTSDNTFEVLPL